MGFFKKKEHNIAEDAIASVSESSEPIESETDDFDTIESDNNITREEFHKMAEETLQNAIADGDIEVVAQDDDAETDDNESDDESLPLDTDESDEADSVQESEEEELSEEEDDIIVDDGDDFDDFSVDYETSTPAIAPQQQQKKQEQESEQEPQEPPKPRMTFAEFCEKFHTAIRALTITGCVFLALCLGIYIYGCATIPKDVMGRNMYIENVNVSGLTYDEALAKVRETALLNDCNITVVCNKMKYTINGVEVGLTPRIEDTVEKAMKHGKSGNVWIDGFWNGLQLVFKHKVIPSANVNEEALRAELTTFGNIVHGELVQHKCEIGDGKIICTPGHTGFSGNTDTAYKQVIQAIEDEKFNNIKVTLNSAPPKMLKIEDIDAFTYTNPQDARYEIANNVVTVIPEIHGRHLKLDEAKALLAEVKEGGEIVNIPYYSSLPNVTAEELNQKLFNAELGSYYTTYGGSTYNRAQNVANAASKINGKVLAPGEVFSFNDTVGKRSVANGFHQAPEYADGQTVMGIGGGTCQVSSTLYNAVLYADLSIVYRLNHMFTVNYCEPGQDATVSDTGIDFKFSNNTDYPIKISAIAEAGKITITILGTQRDVPQTVKIQNYSTFTDGNRRVTSYRMVYDMDGNLIRKDTLPSSYYMAHQ